MLGILHTHPSGLARASLQDLELTRMTEPSSSLPNVYSTLSS